ncbi:hypothetical protein LWM68_11145 [Niabella sp. W65]|nr:hypothetical protein [Niabella sp. W65]MCH7363267.1 hypothetical protein [Niabella sp. W65]
MNTGDIRFSEQHSCVLDWVAWLELSKKKGAFIFVNKKLVKHRIHIDSETTNQIQNGTRYQEELEILSGIWEKVLRNYYRNFIVKGTQTIRFK